MKNVDAAGLGIGDDYPPRVMGVLNVSEESPYDPSVYDDPAEAAAYVDDELVAEGADIVDVGLESANKRFDVLTAEQELDRLETAVEAVERAEGEAVFSLETRYAAVADEALSRGFDMVNDICGFADPEMRAVCEAHDAAVVKMASPPDLTRPGAVEDVDDIYAALERGGLTEKTIVDPAFGGWSEAKTLADDRETFRRLREFRGLDRPILVSINRKNFLGDIVGRETDDRLPASLAATAMAVERGAHVVRTHDVRETVDAARIGAAFARGRLNSGERVSVEELDVTADPSVARHLDRVDANGGAADRDVRRAFELAGISADDRTTLAGAAERAGAVFAAGRDGSVLVGTPAALADISSQISDESERLTGVVRELEESVGEEKTYTR